MKQKRRILFITTEIAPFNPDTPLSEMSRHLPRIYRTQSHDIRVIIPKYNFIRDRKYNLREVIRLREIPVPLAGKLVWVAVKSGFIPDTRVQVYFLENEEYFNREGVLNDPSTGEPYPDNDERFIVFCRAAVEMLRTLSWQPQIVHCTDWTSGLVPYYIRKIYAENPFYQASKTILSLVNCDTPGTFPPEAVFKAGINPLEFKPGFDAELEGKLSFLKAGALYSDMIVTTGEISTNGFPEPEKSWLQGYLKENPDKHSVQPLGIDHHIWNPDKDDKISTNFTHKELDGKLENRKVLLEKYKLKVEDGAPLVGCIWDGGNFEALEATLEYLKSIGGAMVLSDKTAEEEPVARLAKEYTGNVGIVKLLTGLTIKQIIAGTDMLVLHPTKNRDLLHLKSMKYGTIPIAPKDGYFGDDIVVDGDEMNGFLFNTADMADNLLNTVKEATDAFKDKKWNAMVKRVMKIDNSWNKVARGYGEVYDTVD